MTQDHTQHTYIVADNERSYHFYITEVLKDRPKNPRYHFVDGPVSLQGIGPGSEIVWTSTAWNLKHAASFSLHVIELSKFRTGITLKGLEREAEVRGRGVSDSGSRSRGNNRVGKLPSGSRAQPKRRR